MAELMVDIQEPNRLPTELTFQYSFVKEISDSMCGKILLISKNLDSIENKENSEYFILKISFKNKIHLTAEGAEDVIKEVKINKKMSKKCDKYIGSDNVVKMLEHGENEESIWMILEYANEGDFFSYFEKNNLFTTMLEMTLIKKYFADIVLGLYFLNKNGYSHRDISTENIFIFYNENLRRNVMKLGDFGQVIKNSAFVNDYCGKPMYQAPEIVKRHPYHGEDIDIWALGIVLFVFIAGCPLYSKARKTDPHYNFFKKNGLLNSIKTIKKYNRFEEDLSSIDLIRDMLNVNQFDRLTLNEVLQHPFLKEEIESRGVVFDNRYTF